MDDSNSHEIEPEPEWCYYCETEMEWMSGYEDLEDMPVCPQCMFLFEAKHCFSKRKNGGCTEKDHRGEVCAICHEQVQNEPHEPAFFILPPDIEPML